eukprot:GGOE01047019.1.p2 GENE.GGOE01047019.1~~GGOE01047019.1.p2  ORF type:complete len:116 (-),score=0.73 GGOE01047019.1:411-758(-)
MRGVAPKARVPQVPSQGAEVMLAKDENEGVVWPPANPPVVGDRTLPDQQADGVAFDGIPKWWSGRLYGTATPMCNGGRGMTKGGGRGQKLMGRRSINQCIPRVDGGERDADDTER